MDIRLGSESREVIAAALAKYGMESHAPIVEKLVLQQLTISEHLALLRLFFDIGHSRGVGATVEAHNRAMAYRGAERR